VIEPDAVKALILQAIPDAQVVLTDLTGSQDHYEARVVSAQFEGKTPLERHRLVYAALGAAMHGPIHALSLKTSTPTPPSQTGDA
jgi:stress-induced morphogen